MSEEKIEETVVLDNNKISRAELEEQKKKKDQKVIENGDGTFKTLKKMYD